jgi:hypothetical protein
VSISEADIDVAYALDMVRVMTIIAKVNLILNRLVWKVFAKLRKKFLPLYVLKTDEVPECSPKTE